jgi:DNA-binding winged helix-turn-helix (wHTH) protein
MALRKLSFSGFVFEPDACVLQRGEYRWELEPRVADLLEFFLSYPDEVHSHDQLVAQVWRGQVVSDEAVRRSVSVLRHVGGGALRNCIKTIYKRGYLAHFPDIPGARQDEVRPELLRRVSDRRRLALEPLLAWCSSGNPHAPQALDELRSAVELDPQLLHLLSTVGSRRYFR